MSRFLTRLAARSLGIAPLVRPRLRGLFEPVQAAVGGLAEEVAGDTGEAVSITVGTAAPGAARPVLARSAPAGGEQPEASGTSSEPPPHYAGETREAPLHDAPWDADLAMPDSAVAAPGSPAGVQRMTGPRPSFAHAGAAGPVPEHAASEPGVPRPAEHPPAKHDFDPARRSAPPRPLLAIPDGPEALPVFTGPGVRSGSRPGTELPDVRITIGRIDLKAQVEPAAPPGRREPRQRRAPVSLEDYLRHGAKGNR